MDSTTLLRMIMLNPKSFSPFVIFFSICTDETIIGCNRKGGSVRI